MSFRRCIIALFVCSSFSTLNASVSMDPMWIFKDLPETDLLYGSFKVFDTSRTFEYGRIFPVDTGDKYDSSYLCLNYQFSTDSIKITDPYDPATVMYKDYRPGYAGLKIDWDNGVTGFPLAKYKYMAIAHKGPLLNHKITIRFGYNTGCGTPTEFQTIGSIAASSTWKVDTIPIPESVRAAPLSVLKDRNYYELQVLINNVDPSGSPSSEKGSLKLDNIAFIDSTAKPAAVINPFKTPRNVATVDGTDDPKKCGCGTGTGLALLPPLFFKATAMRRRKKQGATGKS